MIKLIKEIIFSLRFKRAVKKADRLHHVTHRKYMVILINRKLKVVSKQDLRKAIQKGVFRKGVTIHDIETKALYITL